MIVKVGKFQVPEKKPACFQNYHLILLDMSDMNFNVCDQVPSFKADFEHFLARFNPFTGTDQGQMVVKFQGRVPVRDDQLTVSSERQDEGITW
jgi:hypothetical protein